jgi:hypothetical protein
VRSGVVIAAVLLREGSSDKIANVKKRRRKISVFADDKTSASRTVDSDLLRISSAGWIVPGKFLFCNKSRF